jgi:hypothetical protein
MSQNTSQLNHNANFLPEPSPDLFRKVMLRVAREQRVLMLKKLFLFVFCFAGSVALTIPAWRTLQGELSRSGFWQYLTIALSDLHVASQYWQDFTWSLLESLPAISAAALLAAFAVSLISLKFIIRYSKFIFGNPQILRTQRH